jgi:hypothetical protein
VAWWAVNKYNPSSVSSNTEYGGLVYRNAAGDFIATEAVTGVPCVGTAPCSVNVWDALKYVPCGASCVVLDYHMHGNDFGAPGGIFEQFSPGDVIGINTDAARRGAPNYFGGVLGTPQGQSYFYGAGTLTGPSSTLTVPAIRAAQISLQTVAK